MNFSTVHQFRYHIQIYQLPLRRLILFCEWKFSLNFLVYSRDLPYVILQNFFNNCQCETYPLYALRALLRIISKSVDDDEDAKPQLMLLVHVTKLRLSVTMSTTYINSFGNMSTQKENAQTAAWIEVADKLITHPSVSS